MSRDRTNNKETGAGVKRRRSSQKDNKDKEFGKDTVDKVAKKMSSKRHESLSESKKIKEISSTKDEDTESQGKRKENRRSKKEKAVKKEENQEKEDEQGEPQKKKKKRGSDKTTVDSKVITKENVKGSGSKGKGKQKVDVNEVTNGDVKDKTLDEGKLEMNKESPKKKKKTGDEPVPRPTEYEHLGAGPAPLPSTGCKYMGCHVSGAGGVWNAFENAEECQATSFALFLRNQRQWMAKPLDEATIKKWTDASQGFSPHLILPHGSYLMNLGSPVAETLEKSRSMLIEELQRCERLGIPHFNFHPGSTVGKIKREECCKLIAESINLAHNETKGVICVLENMSCQGFTIGGDLHELRLIIQHVMDKSRVGVCIDTCHAHAAGYDLSKEDGFQELLDDFGKIIGWQFLRGIHMNDSKGKVGDHQDRHENIGHGTIGIEGFRRIMNCEHFNDLPLILETPWTDNKGYAKEIKKLQGLINK